RVHHVLAARLATEERLERLYREIELPIAEILFRMERHGVLIDSRALAEQSAALGRRLVEIEAEAHRLAGRTFNLNSPKQLAEILFDHLG
ncbi:DNA polymerase, partial [Tepidimonas sp.]|uniref:DNA polymerase n=1 Tax=Tepidimonas sp. TaxID=2002775 RepID=UPI00391C9436